MSPSNRSRAWLKPLHDWPRSAVRALQSHGYVARVVIAETKGSAPREAGACMLVGRDWISGTIGGGQLEWVAIQAARSLICHPDSPPAQVRKVVLGTELAQCCGGVVLLWIERWSHEDLHFLDALAKASSSAPFILASTLNASGITRQIVNGPRATPFNQSTDQGSRADRVSLEWTSNGCRTFWERVDRESPSIWLYGAGHVGQALIQVLQGLPLRVKWIDSRRDLLARDVDGSVEVLHTTAPSETVRLAPPATRFIIMTHSHPLDFALCSAVLDRADFAWAGVIGSKSKGARFRSQLTRHGVPAAQIARLNCPIGIEGIDSKYPTAIAVAVAAQLLQNLQAPAADEISETSVDATASRVASGAALNCTACGAECGVD